MRKLQSPAWYGAVQKVLMQSAVNLNKLCAAPEGSHSAGQSVTSACARALQRAGSLHAGHICSNPALAADTPDVKRQAEVQHMLPLVWSLVAACGVGWPSTRRAARPGAGPLGSSDVCSALLLRCHLRPGAAVGSVAAGARGGRRHKVQQDVWAGCMRGAREAFMASNWLRV